MHGSCPDDVNIHEVAERLLETVGVDTYNQKNKRTKHDAKKRKRTLAKRRLPNIIPELRDFFMFKRKYYYAYLANPLSL